MTEQTNVAPELTDEQRLAALEKTIEAFPQPLRRQWEEIIELERNRQRCRAIELATKVTLPPDNRWGASAPPPTSTPQAEPSPERPSGWRPLDPVGQPPGLRWIDAQLDAQDRKDRMELEREYRQYLVDAHWEAKLVDEQRRREQAESTCHVGPQDPDFPASS
jgi:hypothetical protein